jgi:hypothetical protein
MRFLKGFIMLGIFATPLAAPVRSTADERARRQVPIRYVSPAAVFDAWRAAQAKRDYRTAFFCLTPASIAALAYQAYVASYFAGEGELSPKVAAVLKKHGVDDASAIYDEYATRYQEKHGVDIRELERQYQERMKQHIDKQIEKNPSLAESGGPFTAPDFLSNAVPARDEELFQQVVADRIKDKPGFYTDVARAVPTDYLPKIGPLQNIRIRDDIATGRATETSQIVHYEALRGQKERKVVSTDKTDKTFHFRRVQGGWLIELLPE